MMILEITNFFRDKIGVSNFMRILLDLLFFIVILSGMENKKLLMYLMIQLHVLNKQKVIKLIHVIGW
ncbi:hypothetical protein MTR67_041691 [Solanum verrucosum]|uniref:Uncharacterized protein n=1 Tax=Solanum verrucosum TaxID=315347 RepID=A0AAF0UMR4_SOLVR|nr:hypothetical protein MTR67_041691 [Solanum verrucosum]